MANDHTGFSGNLGDLAVSIEPPAGATAYQLQVDPRLRVPSRWGRTGDATMVSPTKETKRGEMGGKESQHLIVLLKRGNRPEGPREGEGCRVMRREEKLGRYIVT